ncbi:tRNA pseudouridine synthase B [Georgenia soli]|uniref:tRNA pseudouridine synthase B n=1 Tax=Georgenia soli TaxID=638953 RepID=A0A2A9EJN9_9MICO|nr:tRNA pseudouridine(55) synthase TruB [Georgenia soli]PFG38472.1 tRNA pseudouridine synthase B [Georgenia soli]
MTTPATPQTPRGAVTAQDGLVVVDKPQGWTSHDVVARTRRLAATRKVGHAGTLDPMATGVLVLGVGRATRLLTYLVGADKIYTATIRLGQRTVTDDAEGEVTEARGAAGVLDGSGAVDDGVLEPALARLRGTVEQVPSAVSAIKVDGRRSYARVRAGEDVDLPARTVTVHRLEITGAPRTWTVDGARVVDLDVLVACSSGTYVRALARDLGRALGTGGHLTALRRTAVGPFTLEHARTVDQLVSEVTDDAAAAAPRGLPVLSLTDAARACFPARQLDDAETGAVRVGKVLAPGGHDGAAGDARRDPQGPGPVTAAFAPDGHVVALLQDRGGKARPVLVLDPA